MSNETQNRLEKLHWFLGFVKGVCLLKSTSDEERLKMLAITAEHVSEELKELKQKENEYERA